MKKGKRGGEGNSYMEKTKVRKRNRTVEIRRNLIKGNKTGIRMCEGRERETTTWKNKGRRKIGLYRNMKKAKEGE